MGGVASAGGVALGIAAIDVRAESGGGGGEVSDEVGFRSASEACGAAGRPAAGCHELHRALTGVSAADDAGSEEVDARLFGSASALRWLRGTLKVRRSFEAAEVGSVATESFVESLPLADAQSDAPDEGARLPGLGPAERLGPSRAGREKEGTTRFGGGEEVGELSSSAIT